MSCVSHFCYTMRAARPFHPFAHAQIDTGSICSVPLPLLYCNFQSRDQSNFIWALGNVQSYEQAKVVVLKENMDKRQGKKRPRCAGQDSGEGPSPKRKHRGSGSRSLGTYGFKHGETPTPRLPHFPSIPSCRIVRKQGRGPVTPGSEDCTPPAVTGHGLRGPTQPGFSGEHRRIRCGRGSANPVQRASHCEEVRDVMGYLKKGSTLHYSASLMREPQQKKRKPSHDSISKTWRMENSTSMPGGNHMPGPSVFTRLGSSTLGHSGGHVPHPQVTQLSPSCGDNLIVEPHVQRAGIEVINTNQRQQASHFEKKEDMGYIGEGASSMSTPHTVSPTREFNQIKRKLSPNNNIMKSVKKTKMENFDFSKPEQLEKLLRLSPGHQVSNLINNPYLVAYLKSSSSDFTSVSCMIQLFDNTLFCQYETLRKRVEEEVLSAVLSNRGFLEAVRYHLCRLPGRANDKERASSVLFIERLCKFFRLVLSSGDAVLAADVLPVDTLWGTTRQLSTQELRFQILHDEAKEIIQTRDGVRQIQYDTSHTRELASDVVVLPTKDELKQKSLPSDLQRNIVDGAYSSELQYLEVQYHLLREDFIHPLRCAVQSIESGEEESHKLKVYDVTIKGEAYSSYDCATFEILFKVPGQRSIQWDRSKRLCYGNLLCLKNDSNGIVIFATVADRNEEDLRGGIVTVDIRTDVDVMALPPMNFQMFESPGFYAAYAPVLRHLRSLQENPGSLPFSQYIVELKTDVSHPKYIADESYCLDLHSVVCDTEHDPGFQCPCHAVKILDDEEWKNLPTPALDDSQKEALHSALTKELAIIQGPPGTGKTHIGLKIVEALFHNRASWDPQFTSTIMVVCYTNHALDQFLEGIIRQIGGKLHKNTKVRRVGGRSKSELIKEYNINKYAIMFLRARKIFGFWKKRNSRITKQIETLNELEKKKFHPSKLQVYTSFLRADYRNELIVAHPFVTNASTENVMDWLGFQPANPPAPLHDTVEDDRRMAGEADEQDIIREYGAKRLRCFFEILSRAEALTEKRAEKVFQLKPEEVEPHIRLQLFKYCLLSTREKLRDALKEGKAGEEKYEEKRKHAMIRCLREADLIGLTTTIAAKHNRLLSEVNAKILIVEEAAEVLEGHVVASLSQKTEHVILIGDHKQLRPKTNDHILARDYQLDVSLFERLVRNGFPHVTLQCQHRMRPEISSLVSSHIYNGKVTDAPVTHSYPDVAGMKFNMFFMDHNEPETIDPDLNSKENGFEAAFLTQLCRYLLKQEIYTEKQITVITPYTGQMFKLRESFCDMPNVKVTSVDSYQGEENDIILLSLVRSEALGFVADHSRICVAMSRAKHGLYVIGNFSRLFSIKSRLWRALVSHVKTQGKFGSLLPLKCDGHKNITEVCKPSDLDHVRDGGCTHLCNSRLPCRHMCPLLCHPDRGKLSHMQIQCNEQCNRLCRDQLHRCQKLCYSCPLIECEPCKITVEKIIPKCGHQQVVPCHCHPKDFICQENCSHILDCGHRCKKKCGEKHDIECAELITRKCPKHHEGRRECYLTDEAYSRRCSAPCGETLMCGHLCQGTCGACRQGRLHKRCKEKCTRILTCSHECKSSCADNCPPCKDKCPLLCPHGPCDHECHKLCLPCRHKCIRECEHQKCSRLCGEPCDCPPCDKPCPKKLTCGHKCMGLCNEECPDVCQICDRENFSDKVPLIFGTEDPNETQDLQIIMLDCGHKFEVKELDKFYRQQNEEKKVQWKCCILCNKPVFKTNRYRDLVVATTEDMNKIKEKEQLLNPREREELLYQLREMVEKSSIVRHPKIPLRTLECFPDKKLQNEYIILKAEGSVKKAIKNMETVMTALPLNSLSTCHLNELKASVTLLQRQVQDFLRQILPRYHRFPSTEQVLYDIQAEQHRIQLLSVVLPMQLELKLSNSDIIECTDQENLDLLLKQYDVRCGQGSVLKISPEKYESSVQYLEQLRRKHPQIFTQDLTPKEIEMIIRVLDTKPGSWYKCPNGHVYNIGECGGAMQESKCPDCNSVIGGTSHRLHHDNTHAGDFDGSQHAAWSTGANLANFDLHDLH